MGILDLGAGRNLVSSALLPLNWLVRVKPIPDPGFKAATRQTVDLQGVIPLHMYLRDLGGRIWFGIMTDPDVSVFLGTKSIDKFVICIVPSELNVTPQQSKPVDIINKSLPTQRVRTIHHNHGQTEEKTSDNTEKVDEGQKDPIFLVRVAKRRRIPACTQFSVAILSRQEYLVVIHSNPHVSKPSSSIAATGIMDVKRHEVVNIWVSNFLYDPIYLLKRRSWQKDANL